MGWIRFATIATVVATVVFIVATNFLRFSSVQLGGKVTMLRARLALLTMTEHDEAEAAALRDEIAVLEAKQKRYADALDHWPSPIRTLAVAGVLLIVLVGYSTFRSE